MSEAEARHALVQAWFRKAREDRQVADALLREHPRWGATICFHAQQSAEKMLKAYLQWQDRMPPRTHDLLLLRSWCEEYAPAFAGLVEACALLTQYSVEARYPGSWPDPDTAAGAVVLCHQVYDFVCTCLAEVLVED